MLYLAPYEGSGTKADPFRPRHAKDFSSWGAVDLRPDPTRVDGFCLFVPPTTADLAGCDKLGEDRTEISAAAARSKCATKLGVDTALAVTVEDLIAELLFTGGKAWKGVIADFTGRKQVYISGKLWAFKQVAVPARGELIDPTDNFNRADENPIAAPWTEGWAGADLRIVSNQMAGPSTSADACWYYASAAATGDHFSEAKITDTSGGNNDWGPACRVQSAAQSWYWWTPYVGGPQVAKYVSGTFTQIESGWDTAALNDVIRIEISGSTITGKKNGTEVTGSPATDTSLTGGQPGVFMFESGIRVDDWQGGDLSAAAPIAAYYLNYYRSMVTGVSP